MFVANSRARAPKAKPMANATAKPRAPRQLSLEHVSNEVVPPRRHGGRRANAGRKRAPGARESVAHRARAAHEGRHPVHVTLRVRRGLPSLRSQRISGMLRGVLFGQRKRRYAATFQVVEFSIQDDHLHLMVEAVGPESRESLRSGISGFAIAFAKRLNMMLGRKGKVWGDRWHGRELASPSEVRNILGYIFRNVVKHGARVFGRGFADPFSSAPRFGGWSKPVVRTDEGETWPHASPRTWLLGKGWRVVGLLDPEKLARPFPKDRRG
jgi:putative transposase